MTRLSYYLTFMLFLAWAQCAPAKNYVVCVGIANYPETKNDLTMPTADAASIETLFKKNGDAKIKCLTDRKATLKNVTKTVKKIFGNAGPDDAIVFFFSGHGVPGGFVCHDGMLAYDDLSEVMMRSAAKHKIVMADACFSGMARNLKQYGAPKAESVGKTSVVYILSSRANEKSKEKEGWRNSIFTAYLERGLQGGADTNRDRVITTRELFNFVSSGVAKTSLDTQHPVMWGNFDDDMPLMVWKSVSKK